MIKTLAITVALGLLVTNGAYARNTGGDDSSNADKFLGLMAQAGIDSPALKETAYFVDSRIDDNRFNIAEEHVMGYNLKLTHDISTPDYKDLELRITPDNANYKISGTYRGVMLTYSMPLGY